jgi:hypothetical protein
MKPTKVDVLTVLKQHPGPMQYHVIQEAVRVLVGDTQKRHRVEAFLMRLEEAGQAKHLSYGWWQAA